MLGQRTEKALRKVLESNVPVSVDVDPIEFKKGGRDFRITIKDERGETLAAFTARSLIAKRLPKKKAPKKAAVQTK